MFKIMLKGNEFGAMMNSDKILELVCLDNGLIRYKFNREEQRLQTELEDGRLLIVKLTPEDAAKLEDARMTIVNKVREAVELMESKKDTIILIQSGKKLIALPKSVCEHLDLSVKFKEGMMFVLNKQVAADTPLTYETLQEKVANSSILDNSKLLQKGHVMAYETSYENLLAILNN